MNLSSIFFHPKFTFKRYEKHITQEHEDKLKVSLENDMNLSESSPIITIGILADIVWHVVVAVFLSKAKYAHTK